MPGKKYLNIRITEQDHARLLEAAQASKASLTYFVTLAGLKLADRVLGKKDDSVNAE